MQTMNWQVIYPEIVLLAMACVVAIVDLFVSTRRITFWLTQATLATVGLLHLAALNAGQSLYGMQGMVVADPLGHLLTFFAALAVMVTLAYAQPYGTELEFVIMVIAVSCVKLLSAHNSTQHTSRKHKV